MGIQTLNSEPDAKQLLAQLRESIESALPGAEVEARCGNPGHFEICVRSEAFSGEPKVRQHQLVYAAIAHLMSGDFPPVHAVDRLECETP
ncbi:MAG: BolA family transcriptional regulator [bacterium]|jgi:acid stress-induced BolA-like protein IbaG/YrbA|nr:BolA family transcriptional regulator [Deltaproteobacteria bacterium]MCP4240909.1 BolA family transcriptional regulator [bacterium]MDP6075538.1 BolA/IbaG family iron-sulfur metabolism protein [Myxococcota bacterium]MDP7300152.1 BolA/IbaG family iron-sulfur metabolism protein [Myxococcota bacterium]MDP7570387.1 BolA/IbaG family iron-sulfur metabolism protein [Myxococcota bacterium]